MLPHRGIIMEATTVNEDRESAFQKSKRSLDSYSSVEYLHPMVEMWVALGFPQECIERLQALIGVETTTIMLRLTSYE